MGGGTGTDSLGQVGGPIESRDGRSFEPAEHPNGTREVFDDFDKTLVGVIPNLISIGLADSQDVPWVLSVRRNQEGQINSLVGDNIRHLNFFLLTEDETHCIYRIYPSRSIFKSLRGKAAFEAIRSKIQELLDPIKAAQAEKEGPRPEATPNEDGLL